MSEQVCFDLQHALVEVVLINGDAAFSAIENFLCCLFDKLPHVYARRDHPSHVLTTALDLRELGGSVEECVSERLSIQRRRITGVLASDLGVVDNRG